MRWRPGDVAVIDSKQTRSGEYCILRRRYCDEYGSNDYFFTERGKKRVIPCAWIVQVVNKKHLDCLLVAESTLMQTGHPNEVVEWPNCEWQPVDYIKYP